MEALNQKREGLKPCIAGFFELLVLAIELCFFREKLNGKDWILIAFATVVGLLMLF